MSHPHGRDQRTQADEPPAIETRADTGGGFWNIGWPLLALGLIVMMSVHACVK
jgi:hypothetical protein